MHIRPAGREDLSAITAILNAEIGSGTASWTETPKSDADMTAWFEERTVGGYPVIVAEKDGEVLGYASFGPFRRGEGYRGTVEHSVYVARAGRRRGVARALMERLIATAREAGYTRLIGGVSADQPASLALHRVMGFKEQGRLQGVGVKHGKRLDLAFMVFDLDQ